MNREFMKKIIKAKRLEYEALKEIMPDKLKSKVSNFEDEVVIFFKDLALEMIKEESSVKRESETKSVKKISVDFE